MNKTIANRKAISPYLSNKITHLMFWMSILVVYIHTYDAQYTDPSFFVANVLQDLFSQGFCRVAVPVFFMMSGYLHFTRSDVTEKALLRAFGGKVRKLVIPYLIWNVLYLIYNIACMAMLGNAKNALHLGYILKSIFLYEANPAFWYVCQLILLFAVSPLLLKLYRHKIPAETSLVVFFIVYLFIDRYEKLFLFPGVFFFSLGAVCAIHFPQAADRTRWPKQAQITVSAAAVATLLLLMVWRASLMDITENVSVLRGTIPFKLFECLIAVAFWYAVDSIRIGDHPIRSCEKDSFFIYATHWLALSVANIVIHRVITVTPLSRILIYLLLPLVTVSVILLVAQAAKKLVPIPYKWVTGGR